MSAWNEYRVRCTGCGWRGVRHARDCECYEDWSPYCKPWSPGPGCPSWVTWPCPKKCLHPRPDGTPRTHLYDTPDSMVEITHGPQFDCDDGSWALVPCNAWGRPIHA